MKVLLFALAALLGVAAVGIAAQAGGRMESQLAGIQLGKPAVNVVKAYGSPRRVQVGTVGASSGQAGGAAAGGMGAPGMPGGDPGMAGGPPGAMGGPPPGMGGGMPGMPGGEGGMPGAGAQQAQGPKYVHWIYEQEREGVVLVFSMSEEGRVAAVTVGDGLENSVNRGGTRRPFSGARTARGIKLGDRFRDVINAYGYPETQQNAGDEVVLTYYDKAGVAFSMKQPHMRVTAITIRDMSGE